MIGDDNLHFSLTAESQLGSKRNIDAVYPPRKRREERDRPVSPATVARKERGLSFVPLPGTFLTRGESIPLRFPHNKVELIRLGGKCPKQMYPLRYSD